MHNVQHVFTEYWPHILFVISGLASAAAAIHAAMTKHDVRAAIGWVAVVLFSPLLGAGFYLVAGINRIRKQRVSQLSRSERRHLFSIKSLPSGWREINHAVHQ